MSDFESHERTVFRDGLAIHQTVTVNRITKESDVVSQIKRDALGGGVSLPFHPDVNILAHASTGGQDCILTYLPPRVDRFAVDVRKVPEWSDEDRRFVIAVPARLLLWKFQLGTYESCRIFFVKASGPRQNHAYDPEIFHGLVPNQNQHNSLCVGSVFRDFRLGEVGNIVNAINILIENSAYNGDYSHMFGMPGSPLSRFPAGFEVPESLLDVPVFQRVPAMYELADSGTSAQLLWFLCRWQAWTENHISDWRSSVDDLCVGDALGNLSTIWRP